MQSEITLREICSGLRRAGFKPLADVLSTFQDGWFTAGPARLKLKFSAMLDDFVIEMQDLRLYGVKPPFGLFRKTARRLILSKISGVHFLKAREQDARIYVTVPGVRFRQVARAGSTFLLRTETL